MSLSRSSAVLLIATGACAGPCAAQSDPQPQIQRYDRDCSAYGEGFVHVEGTRTCVRVGGHVRVEMGVERPQEFRSSGPFDTPRAEWRYTIQSPRIEGPAPTDVLLARHRGD